MLAHAQLHTSIALTEAELFTKMQAEIVKRYEIDGRLASEMAWDLLEVLSAVDGDIDMFEKYFLR